MAILNRKDLLDIEEYYCWLVYRSCLRFPIEMKDDLLGISGIEPHSYTWTVKDILEETLKIMNI